MLRTCRTRDLLLVCFSEVLTLRGIAAPQHFGQKPNSIVLIPSQSDQDTQAALLMPPDSISITMGKNSFQENIRRARQANITLITHMYLHSQRELEYASMNSTRA